MGAFGRLQKCRRRCMDKTDHEPHYGHVLPDELVAGPETRDSTRSPDRALVRCGPEFVGPDVNPES